MNNRMSYPDSSDEIHWDEFLQSTILGQFQQSSLWGNYKKIGGWQPKRIIIHNNKKIVSGFQIVNKKKSNFHIGYVSKGPVVMEENIENVKEIIAALLNVLHENKMDAVIIQPPDHSFVTRNVLLEKGFFDFPWLGIREATLLVPVGGGIKKIESRMDRETRRMIRQGISRGVLVREGNLTDIRLFFEMMSASCKRQGVETPNPGNVEALGKLWEFFDSPGRIRLTLAEVDGEPLAGLLCICFGNRVTLWKKGWTGKGREFHPNDILCMDAFSWALKNGYSECDFAGLNIDTAHALVQGKPLTEEQRSSYDFFNLQFGGTPRLLPKTMIYLRNPLARRIFTNVVKTKQTRRIFNIVNKYLNI